MESDKLESSKFYSYKYKNFSTIIILPAFLLIVILFISSFFATKENVIRTMGVVAPQSSIKIKNATYNEGDVVPKGKQILSSSDQKIILDKQSIVHISDKGETILFPDINDEESLEVVSYVSGQDIASLKKSQKVRFELDDQNKGTTIINGRVKSVSIYPESVKEKAKYEIVSLIKPTKKDKSSLRYGMRGQLSVIIGKQTYFNYLKSVFLDNE